MKKLFGAVETFEDIIETNDNNNSIKFEKLIDYVKDNKVYISLLFMDFTYLNKKHGYDAGNDLKGRILSYIESSKNRYGVIYYSITSSKVYLYTKSEISPNFKNEVDGLVKSFKDIYNSRNDEKIDTGDKKLVFIVDRDDFNNNSFVVGPYNEDLKELFKRAINIEVHLSQFRKTVQRYLRDFNELHEKGFKADDIENLDKIQENELNILRNDFDSNSNLNDINLDFISNDNAQNISNNDKHRSRILIYNIQRKVKDSKYLSDACGLLNNWVGGKFIDYQKDGYYKDQIHRNIIKYLIWE